jgi:hypothetical protein
VGIPLRAQRNRYTPYWKELHRQRRALDAELRAGFGLSSVALSSSGRF